MKLTSHNFNQQKNIYTCVATPQIQLSHDVIGLGLFKESLFIVQRSGIFHAIGDLFFYIN
jgi:hypothetical protein